MSPQNTERIERLKKKTRLRLVVVYLFTVAAFSFIVFLLEKEARERDEAAYESCLTRNVNLGRMNKFYNGMIVIEKANPLRHARPGIPKSPTPDARIRLYKHAIGTPVDCERLK